jgi:hypothetical protein
VAVGEKYRLNNRLDLILLGESESSCLRVPPQIDQWLARDVAKNRKSRSNQDSAVGSTAPSGGKAPTNRIEKISDLLSELADLMRQEDLGKESLHHLRQLQMRIRFAQESPPPKHIERDAIPERAPALWRDRQPRDITPIDFIRATYRESLGHGLTKAHLRSLDMTLYQALKHYLNKNKMPEDFDLPTKREMTDRELAGAKSLSIIHSPEQRERLRLQQAARRRAQKTPGKT